MRVDLRLMIFFSFLGIDASKSFLLLCIFHNGSDSSHSHFAYHELDRNYSLDSFYFDGISDIKLGIYLTLVYAF